MNAPFSANLSGGDRPAGAPWSVADAAQFLGISDRHLWRLIFQEKVKAIKFGRRVLIADAELRRLAMEGCHP
jgi:excisionase family DNA binding protein